MTDADRTMIRRLAEAMGYRVNPLAYPDESYGGGVFIPKGENTWRRFNPLTSAADMMEVWRWAVKELQCSITAYHYPLSATVTVAQEDPISGKDRKLSNVVRDDGDLNRAVVEAIDQAIRGGE